MTQRIDRDITRAPSGRQTNWIPPVPRHDSRIRGWKRVDRTGWLLSQIIGAPLIAGTTVLFLKFIFSNGEPSPVEKSFDYRGPQFFIAFNGGLGIAVFIAVTASQLRHDIAGTLAAVSLFLSVPALLWLGAQVLDELMVSEWTPEPVVYLPHNLFDTSFNAVVSVLCVMLTVGLTLGYVFSVGRDD